MVCCCATSHPINHQSNHQSNLNRSSRRLNHHLQASGYPRSVSNFNQDLLDLNALVVLAYQLVGMVCPPEILQTGTSEQKARAIMSIAAHLRCPELVGVNDLINGSERVFLTLLALLFHAHSGLAVPASATQTQEQQQREIDEIVRRKLAREEQQFRERLAEEERRLKSQWAAEEEERRRRWAEEDAARQSVRSCSLSLSLPLSHKVSGGF